MADDKANMGDAAPPPAPEVMMEEAPKPEPTPSKAMRDNMSKTAPEPAMMTDMGTKPNLMKDFWLCIGILLLFLAVCSLGTVVIYIMGVKEKDFGANRIKGYHGVVNRAE